MKILWGSDYDDMVKFQVEILKENAELRKSCQCRECKHGQQTLPLGENKYGRVICRNEKSDNHMDVMNPYGSCEKCERR